MDQFWALFLLPAKLKVMFTMQTTGAVPAPKLCDSENTGGVPEKFTFIILPCGLSSPRNHRVKRPQNYNTRRNLFIYLLNRKSDSTVITSYSYTLDNVGNRLQVIEHSGRTVDYTYDDLRRLETETIAVPGDDVVVTTYVMDDVGNRLSKDTCDGVLPVCETVSYVYVSKHLKT